MSDDFNRVLHILRNPWGHDDNELADARRKGADAIEALQRELAAAREDAGRVRAETIERAAKIAQGHFIYGHSVAGPEFAAICANAIRALASADAGEGK